jgi:hypothetical protein
MIAILEKFNVIGQNMSIKDILYLFSLFYIDDFKFILNCIRLCDDQKKVWEIFFQKVDGTRLLDHCIFRLMKLCFSLPKVTIQCDSPPVVRHVSANKSFESISLLQNRLE